MHWPITPEGLFFCPQETIKKGKLDLTPLGSQQGGRLIQQIEKLGLQEGHRDWRFAGKPKFRPLLFDRYDRCQVSNIRMIL